MYMSVTAVTHKLTLTQNYTMVYLDYIWPFDRRFGAQIASASQKSFNASRNSSFQFLWLHETHFRDVIQCFILFTSWCPAMIRDRRLPVLIESRDAAADAGPVRGGNRFIWLCQWQSVIFFVYMTIKRGLFLIVCLHLKLKLCDVLVKHYKVRR